MRNFWLIFNLLLWGLIHPTAADSPPAIASTSSATPISIIIDDLGDREADGRRAVDLPGAFTYAFLPHTPYARSLAERAHAQRKEIMLHLPMESESGRPLGPGGLTQCMTQAEFKRVLRRNLAAIPHVRGINNHMGSLLTKSPLLMDWMMQTALQHGALYFVDSRTTKQTIALQQAQEFGVANAARDVFLDNVQEPEAIKRQLELLIEIALRNDGAVAIGHPYPATLKVLESVIPQLASQGVRLIPVSELIKHRAQRRLAWQTSSSRSPRVVKNSKP